MYYSNYDMSMIITLFVCLQTISCVNAQTWSTWASCSYPETCDKKTELTCTNGRLAQCRSNGSLPYQITLSSQCNRNCDAFNYSQWQQPYTQLKCQGTCYDALQIIGYSCTSIQSCRRLEYYRCYNEQTCRGIWKQTGTPTQCSSSCGGGTRSVTLTCVDPSTGNEFYNCNGTNFGQSNEIKTNPPCNTQSCPSWLLWNEITSCSRSCGNGTQRINSTCMYNGTISMLCSDDNVTTREETVSCNLQACSGSAGVTSSFIRIGYATLVTLVFIHCEFFYV